MKQNKIKIIIILSVAVVLFATFTSLAVSNELRQISPKGFQLFEGFESGQLDPIWRLKGRIQLFKNNKTDAVVIQNNIVRSGKYAAKVKVKRGYERQHSYGKIFSERTELDAGELPLRDKDLWYGFSMFLPSDFPEVNNRLSISQWKQSEQEGCLTQNPSPMVSMRYEAGEMRIAIRLDDEKGESKEVYRKFIPKFEKGRWHDFVYQIKFSDNGYARAWMDNKKIFEYKGRTVLLCGSDSFYHKIGLYRDEWPQDMIAYFDNYTRGFSFREVDPARFDQ